MPDAETATVEIGGQVMTQAQFDAARFPLTAQDPGPATPGDEYRWQPDVPGPSPAVLPQTLGSAMSADLRSADWFERAEADIVAALAGIPRTPCGECKGSGGVGAPGRSPVACYRCAGTGRLPAPMSVIEYLRLRVIDAEDRAAADAPQPATCEHKRTEAHARDDSDQSRMRWCPGPSPAVLPQTLGSAMSDEEWTLDDEIDRASYSALIGAGDARPQGIVASVAASEGDDGWTHSWWCSGDPGDCRFNGCKPPPVSGVAGNPEEAGEK